MKKKANQVKRIEWINTNIYGAVTLKDLHAPEQNNMALHVCIDPDQVMKNRNQLSKELQIPLSSFTLPWQKHTDHLVMITKQDIGAGATDKNTSIMNADAIYTDLPGVLIGVFTADCVGILIVDESKPALCAIHSGWKGTAQAITHKSVSLLNKEKKIDPARAKAFFSPSILKDSLEVGMEVVEQINAMGKRIGLDTTPFIQLISTQKALIDNQGLNAQMLINNGFQPENIHLSNLDTKKELTDCFSYRNDKQCGEHFTFGYIYA